MNMLQPKMTGEMQMSLTVKPSELARRLRKAKGIANVALWQTPFEALWYRPAFARRMEDEPLRYAEQHKERALFLDQNPLYQGRQLHFRGGFQGKGERDAKQKYLMIRVDKATIDKLIEDADSQKSVGLVQEPRESDSHWMRRLISTVMVFREGKQHASYWLGLVHFENGSHEAAIDWLDTRTLAAYEDGRWSAGSRYNLARTYEATGDYSAARRLLLNDESPQRHGNLVRARILKVWRDVAPKDSAA